MYLAIVLDDSDNTCLFGMAGENNGFWILDVERDH